MNTALSDFKKLIYARFFFTLAVQMQAVVVGWRIYELTNDPLSLGLIGLAEAVPALSLALYAGYIVDRSRPVGVYRWVLEGSFIATLILMTSALLQNHIGLFWQIMALYVASIFTGGARAFSQPAMYAIVPRIIKRENLSRAQAKMGSTMQIARVAGPALGGLVFGFLGITASFVIISSLLAASLISTYLIKTQIEPPAITGTPRPVKDELVEGARFVFKHPILFPALTLDMVSVLFGGVTALLPIFAKEILNVGPRGLGALRAAPAVGAALMGLYLSRVPLKQRAGSWLFTAVSGFGVCILVFAASKNFFLSLFALAMSGVFDSVSVIVRSTAVQLASPDHMRGRISAVNSMFIGSSNELGELESGIAAKLMGTVPAAYFGGIICILTVGVVAFFSPTLRKLDLEKVSA
ncbi:MFS transporter [Bdellovibrio bacteriovorus]|uniref:MFS transporter n=1 Tax=Bdellovibrio TaxID=958 RepID=UPI0035A88F61